MLCLSSLEAGSGSAPEKIASESLRNPVSLAIDYIGNKLYVADLGAKRIDVLELSGAHRAIVISRNLTAPLSIALDPPRGLMFFSDSKRIERAHMDGSARETLVDKRLYYASSVALDTIAERVYFCDSRLDFIETVRYDGSDRQTVVRGSTNVPHPYGLAVFEGQVYWSDWTRLGVLAVQKWLPEGADPAPTIRSVYVNKDEPVFPMQLQVVHPLLERSEKESPCGASNGHCEQMCIVTRRSRSDAGLAYRCACSLGYKLSENGKTCARLDEFLIYSSQSGVRGVQLDAGGDVASGIDGAESDDDRSLTTAAMLPVVGSLRGTNFVALDYDYRKKAIYYSDVVADIIYRIDPDGSNRRPALLSDHEGVEGLAVDWVSSCLFFIDSGKSTLNVMKLDQEESRNASSVWRRVILSDLNRPRAIVVHPGRGYIFFTEWQRPANISRSFYNGQNKTLVRRQQLGWPNGLAIDYDADRLYWCDALLDQIQHSDLDGNDVQTITGKHLLHPFSLVVHQEHVYFTDWRFDAVVRADKRTGADQRILTTIASDDRLYGVKIFSQRNQKW